MRRLTLLFACASLWGAIPADTVWEVQHAGSDLNGCGFSVASKGATGVDMTYGGGAAVTSFTSTLSGAGTTALTDSANGFLNTMLGNSVNIAGQGVYVITGFTSASVVTVDRNLGTFSTTSGKIGGACATPGYAAGLKVAGNDVWIKSDATYAITSASSNVANGVVLDSTGGTTTNNSKWTGYASTRGDDGTPPTLQASGIASVSILKVTGSLVAVRNIKVDGASLTSIKNFEFTGSYGKASLLTAINGTNRCIDHAVATAGFLSRSSASGCSGDVAIVVALTAFMIEAHDNTVTTAGIGLNNGASCAFCLAYRNGGTGGIGIRAGSVGAMCVNCVAAYNVANYAVLGATGNAAVLVNSISYGTTSANGFKTDQVQDGTLLLNCAGEAASYTSANLPGIEGFVTLTADPFTNVSSSANGAHDFSLNNNAGGGAALRAAGIPGTMPGGAVGYLDIGVTQHASAAASAAHSSAGAH